jgi:hypothetical protein
LDNPPSYRFEKILLFTDGYCGSACAELALYLHEVAKVKTIVMGGLHNVPQQYFTFPGGQVLTNSWITGFGSAFGVSSDLIPPLLPDTAQFSFTFQEIYKWSDVQGNVPIEFSFEAADVKLPIWTVNSEEDVWSQVAQHF